MDIETWASYLYREWLTNPKFTGGVQKWLSGASFLVAWLITQESIYLIATGIVGALNYWDFWVTAKAKKKEDEARRLEKDVDERRIHQLRTELAAKPSNTLDAYLQMIHFTMLTTLLDNDRDRDRCHLRVCVQLRLSATHYTQITEYNGARPLTERKAGRQFSMETGIIGKCLLKGVKKIYPYNYPVNRPKKGKRDWLKTEFNLEDAPERSINLKTNSWLFVPIIHPNPQNGNPELVGCLYLDSHQHDLFGNEHEPKEKVKDICNFFLDYLSSKIVEMIENEEISIFWASNSRERTNEPKTEQA